MGDQMTEETEIVIDEKKIQPYVEKALLSLEKKDYRATVVHRDEKGQLPDAVTELINIKTDQVDDFGNPIDLDVKGSISPTDAFFFGNVDFAVALSELKDWAYIERPTLDKKTKQVVMDRIPIDLAQVCMYRRKFTNLSILGQRARDYKDSLRAYAGSGESMMDRVAGWAGLTQRKTKDEIDSVYGRGEQR